MAVELFPEMAQSVFRPLLQRLDQDRSEGDFSTNEIRELIVGCGVGAALLDHLMEGFRAILRNGMEKRKLNFLQKEFLDVVTLAADQAYSRVQEIAASHALPPEERAASLEALKEYIKRAKLIGEELRTLEPWLQRPRPNVDVSAFNGHGSSEDYQGYEDTKDMEARLRAGGDI